MDAVNDPRIQNAPYRARLDRVTHLFTEFSRAWADHLATRPHGFTTTVDPDGSGRLEMVVHRPIPNALPLTMGELLYQLRAALDNALYTAAIIDSGEDPPPGADKLQWPVCATRKEWRNQKSRLQHLRPHLVEMLEAIQPYNAEAPDWNCLTLLNDLARIDRHRTLQLVALYPVTSELVHNEDTVTEVVTHPGVVRNGSALVTFRYSGVGPIGPEDIDGHFEFDVELADVSETQGPDGIYGRPYGSLERRLRVMFDVLQDYMNALCLESVLGAPEAAPGLTSI